MEHESEHFATICSPVNPVAVPIITSSTYLLDNAEHGMILSEKINPKEGQSPWLYSRWGNPTNEVAAQMISNLEGGKVTFVLNSGMAAISTSLLAFVKSGDHIIGPNNAYGGTYEVLKNILPRYGIETTFVDSSDISNYEKALKPNTKVIYGETPSNPTVSLMDLKSFGEISKKHNILSIIDSTFASPYNQQPLKYGIDIVIHSATKYLGGHSDLLGGSITCSDEANANHLFEFVKLFGNSLSAMDSFLLQRGIKTLDVRMERHNRNALEVAMWLEKHPKIVRVFYPGLKSHPQHELAKSQMKGFGGMIAFEVTGGIQGGKTVIENVKLINLAVSLGGVDSLIEHAASMTHVMVDRETRMKAGITDGLIRFSVGLEDARDIISDLDQALKKVIE